MNELKPCPFCGGEAVIDKYPVGGYAPAVSFAVRCSVCGQKRFGGYFDTIYKSEKWARKKAIEAWNKRPNPWHTGIPTEWGLYLVQYMHGGYEVVLFDPSASGWDIYSDDSPKDIVKWQKIELEERKEK